MPHRGAALAVALTLLAGLAMLAGPGDSRGSDTQKKLDRVEEKIESDEKREGVLTSKLDELGARVDQLQLAVDSLRAEEADAESRLAAAEEELAAAVDRLEVSIGRLEEIRKHLKRSLAALRDRLVDIYVAGSPDLASIALAADEYGDIVELDAYLDAIQSRDESLIERVRELRNEARAIVDSRRRAKKSIEESRDEIAAERDRLSTARSEIETQVASLDAARAESQSALGAVRGRMAQEEELADELREKLERELGAITSEGATGPSTASGDGSMIWPIDGILTSPFGPRWGRTHEGLDISGPEGMPIVAAADGTVALMQSEAESGGYGIFTCVDHGGGVSTCYAHQSAWGTSLGASVKQGEVIGYVGNTGNSYGAHVHFEVRINGAATDPMAYL